MHFTRRSIRSTLRAVIPLLALVWTSLPMHHCNLALAALAAPGTALAADATGAVPSHCHQDADATKPARSVVHCSDLGSAAPDLRPTVALDTVLVHVSFDAHWLERGLRPVALPGGARPLGDGRWRLRPLHLQKAALLI